MSRRSGNSLIVKPKVSLWLGLIFTFLYAGAAILLFVVTWALPGKIVVLAIFGVAAYVTMARHVLRRGAPRAVEALRLDTDGVWAVRFSGQADWRTFVPASRFVHERLVLLSGRVEECQWSLGIALAADAVDAETFRRLRAALLAPPQNQAV